MYSLKDTDIVSLHNPALVFVGLVQKAHVLTESEEAFALSTDGCYRLVSCSFKDLEGDGEGGYKEASVAYHAVVTVRCFERRV